MLDNRLYVIGKYKCYDYESITIDNSVKTLTASKFITQPKGKRAIITVETASIRYRNDGTDPTSSEGHLINAMDVLIVEGIDNMTNLKMTRVTGTSATIRVSYER